jgi:hypothetical protein
VMENAAVCQRARCGCPSHVERATAPAKRLCKAVFAVLSLVLPKPCLRPRDRYLASKTNNITAVSVHTKNEAQLSACCHSRENAAAMIQ